MEQKKDFPDELEQNMMLAMVLAATLFTLLTFVFQFFAPGLVPLFKQLSFYAYGWMVFLSLGPVVKRGAFMRIDLLAGKYPAGVQKALKAVCELIMFALVAVMCFFSWRVAISTAVEGAVNAAVPAIPLVLAYAAPAVGYTLGVVAYLRRFAESLKGGAKE